MNAPRKVPTSRRPHRPGPRFDAFAKTELAELLTPFGQVESSIEVHPHTRWIDLGFTANSDVTAEQMESSLGLLGRIAFKRALFEPYSTSLTQRLLAEVAEKRLSHLADERRAVRRGRGTPSLESTLWVLAPTASVVLLQRVHAEPRDGWPVGVFFTPPPLSLGVVVLHALPCIPATLWLRFLGRGRVQAHAFEELLRLPEGAPFREETLALAIRWRTMKQGESRSAMTQVEKELWKNSEKLYEQFCHKLRGEGEAKGLRKGVAKGRREGKSEGLREGKFEGLREGEARGLRTAIRDLCDVLNIPLTKKHEQMLAALDSGQLEGLRVQIKRDRRW